ncbi:hypothetical protein J6590_054323 [Homalodisca vitripennis]|nr:hypothetical protein J6590_054323 [Homalodisca vitripennis]
MSYCLRRIGTSYTEIPSLIKPAQADSISFQFMLLSVSMSRAGNSHMGSLVDDKRPPPPSHPSSSQLRAAASQERSGFVGDSAHSHLVGTVSVCTADKSTPTFNVSGLD